MKEEAQLTFKPSVNQYHDVRANLDLRHPEAYLAQVNAKRQAQLAQRLEERRSREVPQLQLLPAAIGVALRGLLVAVSLSRRLVLLCSVGYILWQSIML